MSTTTPVRTSGRTSTLTIGVLVLLALAGAVIGGFLGPHGRMGGDRVGDPDLIADTEAAAGTTAGLRSLAVGRIEDGASTTAGLGDAGSGAPDPQTRYELGSITKTFTGLLLADGIERTELTLEDRLAQHLPELADTAAGAITLRELATHTSGLPSMPDSSLLRNLAVGAAGGDPYRGWTTSRVIDAARTAERANPGEPEYSNFGIALLGAAQARAAGVDSWTDLAHERLLRPLGMTQTTFGDTPDFFAAPHHANGWPASPWVGEGFFPAGTGTRSTVADMLRYADAILDGRAPGLAALQPLHQSDETDATGMAWQITTDPNTGRQTRWHNGGTGGSRTMLAIDTQQRRAAIVLSNTDIWVNGIGLELVGAEGSQPRVETVTTAIGFGVLAIAIAAVGTTILRAFRGPTLMAQLSAVAWAIFTATLMLRLGPWAMVPAAVPGALIGLIVGAAAVIVGRKALTRTPPALPTAGRWSAGLDLGISAVLAGFGLWALWP